MRQTIRVALAMILAGAPAGASAQFATLPAGAEQTHEIDGVRVEIVMHYLLVDSADIARLPAGRRAWTMRDWAPHNPEIARFVNDHPRLASAGVADLAFALIDSLTIDGTLRAVPQRMAFLWLRTVPLGVPDARPAFAELMHWRPDGEVVADVGAAWPLVFLADVRVDPASRGWRLALEASDVTVEGDCEVVGVPERAEYPLPAIDTVWSTAPGGGYMLYTYYGHVDNQCTERWHVEGTGPLMRAFANRERLPASRRRTTLMDSWRARGAVYSPRGE